MDWNIFKLHPVCTLYHLHGAGITCDLANEMGFLSPSVLRERYTRIAERLLAVEADAAKAEADDASTRAELTDDSGRPEDTESTHGTGRASGDTDLRRVSQGRNQRIKQSHFERQVTPFRCLGQSLLAAFVTNYC